ncbi:BLUF domain-containing protein [Phytohalomonas tamaricis]|uniref:BLUF domain-containing protein n=1 Tax=Phytohalomonas tamaricis TaxID=2081032 RepID=UPI000D0B8912|nr:BLUF domain-containing protein [Phytohalomonas tamaricis]
MNDALYRLVYVSRNDIEGDDATMHREIEQILDASRRNNARAGIFGALMFNMRCFAQVLEGPRAVIEDTFERIQHDIRHSNVAVLDFKRVDQCTFAQWSMAYVGADTQAARQFALSTDADFTAETLDAEHIYRLLKAHMFEAACR